MGILLRKCHPAGTESAFCHFTGVALPTGASPQLTKSNGESFGIRANSPWNHTLTLILKDGTMCVQAATQSHKLVCLVRLFRYLLCWAVRMTGCSGRGQTEGFLLPINMPCLSLTCLFATAMSGLGRNRRIKQEEGKGRNLNKARTVDQAQHLHTRGTLWGLGVSSRRPTIKSVPSCSSGF